MSKTRSSSLIATTEPFLILQENRFAYTAVASIAAKPATDPPRPLFLYGPSGVGKSHLARHAVRLLLRRKSDAQFEQIDASQFAAELAEASASQTLAEFQAAGRNLDLFIVEDVQALERRPETQRQLLAYLDDLTATGCQIICTSRKSPGELTTYLPKLVNRFHSGVTALVRLPSLESRISLIGHFAKSRQLALPADAVRVLASALPVSPRELLAAVRQIEALSVLEQAAIDAAYVRKYLTKEVRPQAIALADIARAVARHFDLGIGDLRSRGRVQGLVLPRQCAMFLSRELTEKKLGQIGLFYGNRDHSTVVHACNRLRELLADDPTVRLHMTQIRNALGVNEPEAGRGPSDDA